MSVASQMFALFFAVLYGALFTISDRWRPFFIRHRSREGWYRFCLSSVWFGIGPVTYFVAAFGVLMGVREADWLRLFLAIYLIAPLVAFHFIWSWMVLADPARAYSPEERNLEPVRTALQWVGSNPVSWAGVLGLLLVFLAGPIAVLIVFALS